MGPLALADQVGLEVGLSVMETLGSDLKDENTVCPGSWSRWSAKGHWDAKPTWGFFLWKKIFGILGLGPGSINS
jgi:3-hydroxyacyl-CoA dehydrogenase